ncbi:MAG TPA: DUF5317 family protein [Acidimicrobiales bacterium]|nr:DUF5317 family protein [Acidimicrobiales bacterium]
MAVIALAVLVGGMAGWTTGATLGRGTASHLGAWWLLFPAIAAEAFLGSTSGALHLLLAVLACLLVVAWCVVNALASRGQTYGFALLATGVGMNTLVIGLNGGMPVSSSALAAAGFPRSMNVAQGHLYKHLAMTAATRLRFLGDFVPVRLFRTVLSPGDIVMLVGIAAITWAACASWRRTSRSTGTIGQSNARPGHEPLVAALDAVEELA